MEYYLASRAIAPGQGHEAGRALLASLYRQHTGQPLPAILRTDRGKPVFGDSPWHFSITHTKAHAFCALAKAPIGIDAEELDRKIDLRLAEKILSPGEKAQWAGSPDRRLALLTFWVLKEARGKCTGAGINGWPNDTDFSLDDPRVQIKDNCLLAVVME
mgnify:CR=1 FL=1